MLPVRTGRDIQRLHLSNALHPKYKNYLDGLFAQIQLALGSGKEDEFDLEPHGYIVVFERGDDPRLLSSVGLGVGGLLTSWPEYVEVVDLGDLQLYKVAVLYDNEYMMLFLSEVGQLDDEAETWLREQADFSGGDNQC